MPGVSKNFIRKNEFKIQWLICFDLENVLNIFVSYDDMALQ